MNRLIEDIDAAHWRRWPDRSISLASRAWILIGSPGLRLMMFIRISRWLNSKQALGGWRAWLWRLLIIPLAPPRWAIQVGAKFDGDVPSEGILEGGICFSDHGHIVYGAQKTGSGTVIGTRVTVGMGHTDKGRPEIGRNVWIGSDCVVYGAIEIGDGATLLPGTVLSKSIPAGVVMQGNPARLVLRNFDNSKLRECQDVDAKQYVKVSAGLACSKT